MLLGEAETKGRDRRRRRRSGLSHAKRRHEYRGRVRHGPARLLLALRPASEAQAPERCDRRIPRPGLQPEPRLLAFMPTRHCRILAMPRRPAPCSAGAIPHPMRRTDNNRKEGLLFKHIMVPVDLAHEGQLDRALGVAADLAGHYGARVTYVGVTVPQPSSVAPHPAGIRGKACPFRRRAGRDTGRRGARKPSDRLP